MLTPTVARSFTAEFAADVRSGLSKLGQKEVPSKYLYDPVGSKLFEVISILPEYGLTRADERLLQRHAEAIVKRLPLPVMVAELGSGSGKKTRCLLEALGKRQPTDYCPIEISPAALDMCRRELGGLAAITLVGFERQYLDGLLEVAARRQNRQRLLVLFLGSTIGNFEGSAGVKFLAEVRRILEPGDFLLLGTDLEKPALQLLAAYDDPLGVTAAFNLNLLARINRELQADFNLEQFRHAVIFNELSGSIEMHLRSHAKQTVHILQAGLSVPFREGETIWTESSHKYSLPEVSSMAKEAGFCYDSQWVDAEWAFAETLLVAA
jgi:L-histidine N-alpha-methyltransferase